MCKIDHNIGEVSWLKIRKIRGVPNLIVCGNKKFVNNYPISRKLSANFCLSITAKIDLIFLRIGVL